MKSRLTSRYRWTCSSSQGPVQDQLPEDHKGASKAFGALVTCALVVCMAAPAVGQSHDRSRQYPARSLGLAGLGRSFASGPNALFINPASLGATSQYLLGGGYTYTGEEPGSHTLSLAWTDSTPNPFHLAMGIVYDYLSFEEGSSQNVHGALAYALSLPSLTISMGLGAHYLGSIGDVGETTTGDAGLTLSFAQTLFLGVAGYNLVSTEDGPGRGVGGGLSFWGGPFMIGLDVSADFDVPTLATDGSASTEDVVTWYGGVQLQMIPEACFRAGVQYDGTHQVTRAAGGLQFVLAQAFGLEFGYMQNVEDGDDMRLGVNLDLYNPFGAPQQ